MDEPIAVLKLSKSAYLKVETDQGQEVLIDVYKARKVLELAEKQPDEESKWAYVEKWLKEQLQDASDSSIAQNVLLEFHDTICHLVIKLNEQRQSKISGMLSLQQPIQASPTSTETGL